MALTFEKAREDDNPSEINLGCGPEPEHLDEDAVRVAAMVLLSSREGDESVAGIPLAKETGAYFYWLYAERKAKVDLVEQVGEDDAWEIIHGLGDRDHWLNLRAKTFASLMKERFGFDLTGGGSSLLPGLKERIPEEYYLTFGKPYVSERDALDGLLRDLARHLPPPSPLPVVLVTMNRVEDLDPHIRDLLDKVRL